MDTKANLWYVARMMVLWLFILRLLWASLPRFAAPSTNSSAYTYLPDKAGPPGATSTNPSKRHKGRGFDGNK